MTDIDHKRASELAESLWFQTERRPVSVLVGRNGAGKSRMLNALASIYARDHRVVIAVANTIHDRFSARGPSIHHLSARRNPRTAEYALKEAIRNASLENLSRLRRIPRTLSHCGYDARVGLAIQGFRADFEQRISERISESDQFRLGVGDDLEDAISLCRKFAELETEDGVLWLDFDTFGFDSINRSVFARFVSLEKILRRLRVISRVEILVSRLGKQIPLRSASSGELSLLATMVFVTSNAEPNCVILIDEPENSLHPQWQREYLDLLMDFAYLYDPIIVIATHAPLVVSGLERDSTSMAVYSLTAGGISRIDHLVSSVEGLFLEVFDTVTPENHYLSEQIVALLNDLAAQRTDIDTVNARIAAFKLNSYDDRQLALFASASKLAQTVVNMAGGE